VLVVALAGIGGCSRDQPSSSTTTVTRSVTATVSRWGSFFGGRPGNFGIEKSPVTVTLPGRVAEVATSNSTQYALLTNGSLYAWGLGTQGQLGNGGLKSSFSTPVRVRFPAGVKIASIPADAMPYDTGLAVDVHGQVWGWGKNGGGELCLGSKTDYGTPVKVPLPRVTALAGASNHAVYDSDGTVYACGQNVAGDLGDGSQHSTTTPMKVAGLNGQQVTKLVASFANSGALLSNGNYLDWGYNANGQLGNGRMPRSSDVPVQVPLPSPVTQVAQGGSLWNNGQTLVLLSSGSLWGWGDNSAGQLGDGMSGNQASPVRFRSPVGVTYQSLATGSATSYAVSTAGAVYAWGVGHLGQVGDGLTSMAVIPVQVATGATAISSTANNVVINVPRNTPGAAALRG
jgi:alpha-tubulin suppressor-like RCC1 family protein